jgi:pre-mRNA-splicing factor CWC22
MKCFVDKYVTMHRYDTSKIRNCSKLFAHLLYTNAIDWRILKCITLTQDSTTSSGRIFIKCLFQELGENMQLENLSNKLKEPEIKEFVEGLFPKDHPKNTRFAINFFTSIG